jgi:hypothetical protein
MIDDRDKDVAEWAVGEIQAFLAKAQSMGIENVTAIAEQFRVEAMLAKATPHRRHIFDAVADHFEHAAETRAAKAHKKGDGIGGVVRALIDSFDDDN